MWLFLLSKAQGLCPREPTPKLALRAEPVASAVSHTSSSALRLKPVEGKELFFGGFRLWKDQVQALEKGGVPVATLSQPSGFSGGAGAGP